MNVWDYLNQRNARKHALLSARAAGKPVRVHRIDARGWIGIGVYLLNLLMIGAMVRYPDLRADEFFKTIATLIVGAFIKDVVGWAYQATKGGGELADRNARLVEDQARSGPEQQG